MARKRAHSADPQTRIDALRKTSVPFYVGDEDLDRPLDDDVVVESGDPRTLLWLNVNGEKVSWLTVIDYQQQIGDTTWRMGGIAGVGTAGDHRFKGYSRRLIDNSLRYMRREGYAVSQLYGVPAYYPKFGYAPAFSDPVHQIAVRDLEPIAAWGPAGAMPTIASSAAGADKRTSSRVQSKFRSPSAASHATAGARWVNYDPTDPSQATALIRLHEKNNRGLTGVLRRPAATWRRWNHGRSWPSRAEARMLHDRKGRLAGYVVFDSGHPAVQVLEAEAASPAHWQPIVEAILTRAIEARVEQAQLLLPQSHALVHLLKPAGLSLHQSFRKHQGAMVRMIDCPKSLAAVTDLLTQRLAGHIATQAAMQSTTALKKTARTGSKKNGKFKPGATTLITNLDRVTLAWDARGRISLPDKAPKGTKRATLPQWGLAQCLYGFRTPNELAEAGLLTASSVTMDVLNAIFPPVEHFSYTADDF